jgi:hypothetical protein
MESGHDHQVYNEPENRSIGVLMSWVQGGGRSVGCGNEPLSESTYVDDDYYSDYDDAEYDYGDGGVLFVQAADWD